MSSINKMRHKWLGMVVALAMILSSAPLARASSSSIAKNSLSLSSAPELLFTSTPVSNNTFEVPKGASTTYAETNYSLKAGNQGKEVSSSLEKPMPNGVELRVLLKEHPGEGVVGAVKLTEDNQILVTDISEVNFSDLSIIYALSVLKGEKIPSGSNETVVYTVGPD